MMQPHTDLKMGIRDDQCLYRYMDVYKLLYVLERKAIFFSTLLSMQDSFEGRLTEKTVETWLAPGIADCDRKVRSENIGKMDTSTNLYLKILCFSIADSENAILWNHYGHSQYSLCIKTSMDRLRNAFQSAHQTIHPGEVEYIDRKQYLNERLNLFKVASLKSLEYQAERELRLFILDPTPAMGISVPVDVQGMIDKVIVSPACSGWALDVIMEVVSRYDFAFPVERSQIIYREKPLLLKGDDPEMAI